MQLGMDFIANAQVQLFRRCWHTIDFRIVKAQQCVHIVLTPATVNTMPTLRDELPLLKDLEMLLHSGNTQPSLATNGFQTGPAAAFVPSTAHQIRVHQKGCGLKI